MRFRILILSGLLGAGCVTTPSNDVSRPSAVRDYFFGDDVPESSEMPPRPVRMSKGDIGIEAVPRLRVVRIYLFGTEAPEVSGSYARLVRMDAPVWNESRSSAVRAYLLGVGFHIEVP